MIEEVVREVWRLFRTRFWRTLITVAVLLAPLELAVHVVDPDLVSSDWWLWVGLTAALVVIAFPWVIGAVVHDVATDDRTPAQAYRQTADRLPDLAISALVTTLGIILGTIALVVPGLILVARWALVVPLIVVGGASWRQALARSNELVRGRTWEVVAIFVVLTLIGAALAALPLLLAYFVIGGVIGAWLAALAVDTVAVAFYAFAPFVLYRRLTT
jgi:hypothetical protein